MSLQLDIPQLEIAEDDAQSRFDELQKRLIAIWETIDDLDERAGEHTVVVVPSLTVDFSALQGSVLQAYEERFLFLLLLLRQPRARLIYVTSQPIHPNVVDYYLGMLPGVIMSHARQRLHTLAPHDGASQPLSIKLLQRPRLLQRLRRLIPDPQQAHLVTFNTTRHERDLALCLGIPLFGADPRFAELGSKSGCRRLFAESGVAHPAGYENLKSTDDVVDAIIELCASRPDATEAMVKHDDGVSGEGNAIVDLANLVATDRDAVQQRVREMHIEAKGVTPEAFLEKLAKEGGVVEERIAGSEITSPSVQLRITPLGEVQLLSTHDQWLGGPELQKYLGCIFPARGEYASAIADEALKVGRRLAELGVLGRFAIDFVCARQAVGWKPYAIEVNLRKGGTTHPFLTLQFLTDGKYDPEAHEFRIAGRKKCYVATDALTSESYRVFTPDDLFDIAVRSDLHYDPTHQTGVIFHMMSAIGDHGRLGLTAIADSTDDARALYQRTVAALDAEAQAALDTRLKLPTV